MIYRLTPDYRPFYQKPYSCVPATMQWILYRHDLDILDQETIGIALGLRLSLKCKDLFDNKNIEYLPEVPEGGYGTQIEKEKYSIQKFFDKYSYPLTFSRMYSFEDKGKVRDFIIKHLSKGDDLILRYSNIILKDADQKRYGHFSVIAQFNDKTNIATLGNPTLPHFINITLDQLILSTSDKIDGIQRGLYVVSKKSNPC